MRRKSLRRPLADKCYMQRHPYCMENKAKQVYGQTHYIEFAGYLLADGTLLNFSYEGYQRDEDHRNIGQFFTTDSNGSGWNHVVAFINRGNIRVSCSNCCFGFELSCMPTDKQLAIMRKAAMEAYRNGIEFRIDVAGRDGRVIRHYMDVDEMLYDYAA